MHLTQDVYDRGCAVASLAMFLNLPEVEPAKIIFSSVGVDPDGLINTKEMQRTLESHGTLTRLTYSVHDFKKPALLYLKLSESIWHWVYYDGKKCLDPLGRAYSLDQLPGQLTRVISRST